MPLLIARRHLPYLLIVIALVAIPSAAPAAQLILTFEGSTTVNAVCNSGPNGVGGGCVDLPSETVRYSVLVDFARRGEDISRDASGVDTVTNPSGTVFADFLEEPAFENTGPSDSRFTRIVHVGAVEGPTLLDEESVDAFPIFTRSSWALADITPGDNFSLGSLWNAHQDEMIVDDSALVKEHRIVIDADVTLTGIRPVTEPGALSFMTVSGVALASASFCARHARTRRE